ncbi:MULTISPECIES: TetR/AcrR family transcriptional regulator [unclassified Arthrobacter]|uniref:TetR/AcrR family transcriptional regulator n=1 Tax=unclassified Arthrobacter TaxID=235627 RepID=UPI00149239CA|nr:MULTISPECIES: TetR/AcrR family transcriptional regulator [unclassified Arthrobacter]MBE0010074.1 TetR/AcrR family transcriptional regulator [Arthrobacter sp. AET 35A]NOJ63952.1 TetR/AcrR family transcriptional regulator [Arthrobacter sp. 147(2020)]
MTAQPSARERLLEAAEDLAFTQGVAATPVDVILKQANVAPATLYAHFGNKEGLIIQALQRRLGRWDEAWRLAVDEASTPRDRLVALLPALQNYRESVTPARWCAFLGVAAESPQPGDALQETLASDTHLLSTRLRELAVPVVGPAGADALAEQLLLIYTGVLGMILRGMATVDAVALGLKTSHLAIDAAVNQPA